MKFSKNYDTGHVTVDKWAPVQEITEALLRAADTIRWEGDDIYISVANGDAHYKIADYDGGRRTVRTVRAVLVEGTYKCSSA